MIDVHDVREMLHRRARRVHAVPNDAPRAARRARRRLALNGTLGTLAVLAVVVSVLAGWRVIQAAPIPAGPPTPTPSAATLRRDGEVILDTGSVWLTGGGGDIVAADPSTGQIRTLVSTNEVPGPLDSAAWSGDGRWLGFAIRGCSPEIPNAGIWVTDAPGRARRLTTRTCPSDASQFAELWAWSPTRAQLVIQRHGASNDSLILIDAATGDQRDLGPVDGTITSLDWSPDGAQVTYATDPSGSIYSVNVHDGVHSLLARSLGYVAGHYPGWWSPDGSHLLIAAANVDATPTNLALYLMNADGSGLRLISDTGSGFAWSPDGSSFALASSTKEPGHRRFRIWTMSPEDRAPTLIFDELLTIGTHFEVGSPLWSPNGSRIAYRVAALSSDGRSTYFVVNADGTGRARRIDALEYLSWRGGWFHCECYG